ncbi:MAG: 5'-nucleotidase [Rubrivivax sp.]|nr:5'-nucleotidase [Rubrivivax sp.]
MRPSFAKYPRQTALIETYARLAALPRDTNPAGASPLGQVIADAQLAATRRPEHGGAQIAFMNPGGIRATLPLPPDGQLRYQDLFAVQPFYNNLVTRSLSDAQLLQLLESQWTAQTRPRILHVSRGFGYTWDGARPKGQRVVPGSVTLDGRPLDPAATYRVTVNSFFAGGGDNFQILRQGRDLRTGIMDVDALELYVKGNPGLVPEALDRVQRIY